MEVPRMRTAQEVCDEMKKLDPESRVSTYLIRKLIKGGKIPHILNGRRQLVDLDAALAYFANGDGPTENSRPVNDEYGRIRRIS
jgi:hypothetical protein